MKKPLKNEQQVLNELFTLPRAGLTIQLWLIVLMFEKSDLITSYRFNDNLYFITGTIVDFFPKKIDASNIRRCLDALQQHGFLKRLYVNPETDHFRETKCATHHACYSLTKKSRQLI